MQLYIGLQLVKVWLHALHRVGLVLCRKQSLGLLNTLFIEVSDQFRPLTKESAALPEQNLLVKVESQCNNLTISRC